MNGAARHPGSEAGIEGTPTTAFGKYQLFASLGRGGMADVFLSVARGQMGFNKLAVLKRLRQALAEEPAFRNMFLDEARLAARLSHPNIVHTYEVGEQGGVYFIAMEYLEGQSLNKVLKEVLRRKERFEPEIAARVVADALAGLHYAHTLADYDGTPLNIIHRDVSPHNIFVTYDGHTKLVDFGIAKAALSSTETEVGVLKGKVAYMSPEQAMGGRIDCRSDLFAMGIVLWELIAGRRLMTGDNAANTLHKLMNEPISRLAHVAPTVDPNLERIVMRALEKDPAHRWQSAADMREALEGWLQTASRSARQEEVGHRMTYLFAKLREEVHRQIQRHMGAITAATNTSELHALTVESLLRMEQSGANVSGQLLRLGASGSGSGSGVIPNYGGLSGPPSAYPSIPSHLSQMQQPPPQKRGGALLVIITIGCFLLAGLAIVMLGLRKTNLHTEQTPIGVPVATGEYTSEPPPATITTDTAPSAPTVVATPTTTKVQAQPAQQPAQQPPVHHTPPPPARPPVSPPVQKTTPPPPTPPAPVQDDPGFLTVSSYPWAKVTAGGKVICAATPCSKVPMPPGPHTLTFENPEQGLKQSVGIVIKSGEVTTRSPAWK